jgi:NADPH:quinone reductase-like Zn-dependent oxidoreductase
MDFPCSFLSVKPGTSTTRITTYWHAMKGPGILVLVYHEYGVVRQEEVMNLANQRIVIMGGSSGIGLATARLLINAGAKVAITGCDQNKIETALVHLGEQATGAVIDATSSPQVRRFFHEYGPFHHLVIAVSGAGGAGAFRTLDLVVASYCFDTRW